MGMVDIITAVTTTEATTTNVIVMIMIDMGIIVEVGIALMTNPVSKS